MKDDEEKRTFDPEGAFEALQRVIAARLAFDNHRRYTPAEAIEIINRTNPLIRDGITPIKLKQKKYPFAIQTTRTINKAWADGPQVTRYISGEYETALDAKLALAERHNMATEMTSLITKASVSEFTTVQTRGLVTITMEIVKQ